MGGPDDLVLGDVGGPVCFVVGPVGGFVVEPVGCSVVVFKKDGGRDDPGVESGGR